MDRSTDYCWTTVYIFWKLDLFYLQKKSIAFVAFSLIILVCFEQMCVLEIGLFSLTFNIKISKLPRLFILVIWQITQILDSV